MFHTTCSTQAFFPQILGFQHLHRLTACPRRRFQLMFCSFVKSGFVRRRRRPDGRFGSGRFAASHPTTKDGPHHIGFLDPPCCFMFLSQWPASLARYLVVQSLPLAPPPAPLAAGSPPAHRARRRGPAFRRTRLRRRRCPAGAQGRHRSWQSTSVDCTAVAGQSPSVPRSKDGAERTCR